MGKKAAQKTLFVLSLCLVALSIVLLNLVLFYQPLRAKLFPPPPENNVENPVLRKVLNPQNISGVYFGVSLDWTAGDTPVQFNARFGRPAAVFQFFAEIHDQIQNMTDLKYVVDMIAKTDGILALTIMPKKGFEVLTDATIDQTVRTMAEINRIGIPVLLRFGHEMNGNWYPYGQKPLLYVEWFRRFADAIHKGAPLTYMVWAPNVGKGYPWFGPNNGNQPQPGSADYRAMDTNSDGVVNNEDSPFAPFWPGEQYVDWIGYSTFHFGTADNLAVNALSPAREFEAAIVNPTERGRQYNIYTDYSQRFNKPFALMETAAAYYPRSVTLSSDPSNLDIKRSWWGQIFSTTTLRQYPLLKIICWFDVVKEEVVNAGARGEQTLVLRDFSVTRDPSILKEFKADLERARVWFADTPLDQIEN
ncbi:glycoside hydrolase superfamily [Paraphysoderma sedebokerense]|nr:glycoside hydrolase superfamily [Paraphysoderma sedebokerense]